MDGDPERGENLEKFVGKIMQPSGMGAR